MKLLKSFSPLFVTLTAISLALIEAKVTVTVTKLQGIPVPTGNFQRNGDCYCPVTNPVVNPIVNPILNPVVNNVLSLPLTFDSPDVNYNFINYNGGITKAVDNPHKTGLNTSDKVASFFKPAGDSGKLAVNVLSLTNPINFSTKKIMKMLVWSPKVGTTVSINFSSLSGAGGINSPILSTTVANQWEELTFDLTQTLNDSIQYQTMHFDFDYNIAFDSPTTYYFDNVRLVDASKLELPLTFESSKLNYKFVNYYATAKVVDNPYKTGLNTSNRVASFEKLRGRYGKIGYSYIKLPKIIDFSTKKTIKMLFWSPSAGIKVQLLFKGKNAYYSEIVYNTIANGWEELTINLPNIKNSNNYQIIYFYFNNNISNRGTTFYYFDNVRLV